RRQGIENYLPLFYEPARLIDDYAPDALLVLSDRDEILARARMHCREIERRYETTIELGRPAFPPETRFLSTAGFDAYFQRLLETHPLLRFSTDPMPEEGSGVIHFEGEDNEARVVALRRARREEAPLQPLLRAFNDDAEGGMRLFVATRSLGNAHRVAQILDSYPIEVELVTHLRLDDRESPPRSLQEGELPRVTVTPAPFSHGFRLPEFGISVVTETEIFGERFRSPKSSPRRVGSLVSSIAQLTPGDPVIHRTYGLGIYRGLETREAGGIVGDFLLIEYAGGDKLWLPADRLDALQRYIGIDGIAPKIDKLGGKAWNRAKARAKAAAQKIAGELLSLYAARQVVRRPPLPAQKAEELAFAEAFPYELTPDQERAIEAVLADLSSLRPMDRLICGDVGFGKTEVAIRAAFRTVMSGRQVAVHVPTTILAL
ncbi:MAG: transcription-repair coupling factor, partial [Deltaproteobacteria bacterium]